VLLEAILAARREVCGELRAIRALLEELLERQAPRRGPRDGDDRRVVLEVANVVADAIFSSGEVVAHAAVAPKLAAALEGADITSPRSLGKLFRRVEGVAIEGVLLERVGEDRAGLLWRIVRVCGFASPQAERAQTPDHDS
jgi:hypothetical protein